MLHKCSETCGWISGLIAALSFGSFGVPIRSTSNLNIDPLVLQTYKSVVCFLTCWLVILLGEPVRFTPWGIISGIFWVPGGVAGIYGIRNAGLALSVGTWSAIIVISSFIWGIFVFKEKVKSIPRTGGAAFVLLIGLIGMSKYSEPSRKEKVVDEAKLSLLGQADSFPDIDAIPLKDGVEMGVKHNGEATQSGGVTKRRTKLDSNFNANPEAIKLSVEDQKQLRPESTIFYIEPPPNVVDEEIQKDAEGKIAPMAVEKEEAILSCFGIFLNRRQLGMIGAIINGAWGSNNIIPMHYAKAQGFFGAGYLISYSCGSMIVTIALWIFRYLFNLYLLDGNMKHAYESLPPFRFREMWLPGFLSGILYSLGNFCAIITVSVLGQGVGYSFIQTSMLVSGLWGIFYFYEVAGNNIPKWFLSSITTVVGILWLSYEHQNSSH